MNLRARWLVALGGLGLVLAGTGAGLDLSNRRELSRWATNRNLI